jgi:single-stranded DNA-binding protein
MIISNIYGKVMNPSRNLQTKTGKPMVKFTLVADVTRYGENNPQSLFINVVGFGQMAERMKGLIKGDQVVVMGKLTTKKWIDKADNEKMDYQVIADSLMSKPMKSQEQNQTTGYTQNYL